MSELTDLLITRHWFDLAIDDQDLPSLLFSTFGTIGKEIPEGKVDARTLSVSQLSRLAQAHLDLKFDIENMVYDDILERYMDMFEIDAKTDQDINDLKEDAA